MLYPANEPGVERTILETPLLDYLTVTAALPRKFTLLDVTPDRLT